MDTHAREKAGGEGRDAEKRESPRLIKSRETISLVTALAGAGRQESAACHSSFERVKEGEREKHRAPSHAIIEPALLAAHIAPPGPHLCHRRQPGRRSDGPTGEAAPTSYGYSDNTSGVEARVGRRVGRRVGQRHRWQQPTEAALSETGELSYVRPSSGQRARIESRD